MVRKFFFVGTNCWKVGEQFSVGAIPPNQVAPPPIKKQKLSEETVKAIRQIVPEDLKILAKRLGGSSSGTLDHLVDIICDIDRKGIPPNQIVVPTIQAQSITSITTSTSTETGLKSLENRLKKLKLPELKTQLQTRQINKKSGRKEDLIQRILRFEKHKNGTEPIGR